MLYLVDWDSICKLKEEGGLGIRPLKKMNQGLRANGCGGLETVHKAFGWVGCLGFPLEFICYMERNLLGRETFHGEYQVPNWIGGEDPFLERQVDR